MALVKAVLIGAVAAIGVPYATGSGTGSEFVEWVRTGVIHLHAAGVSIPWSWPIFCIVTLFAWGMLAWANR